MTQFCNGPEPLDKFGHSYTIIESFQIHFKDKSVGEKYKKILSILQQVYTYIIQKQVTTVQLFTLVETKMTPGHGLLTQDLATDHTEISILTMLHTKYLSSMPCHFEKEDYQFIFYVTM
jgi:hypothetical protein